MPEQRTIRYTLSLKQWHKAYPIHMLFRLQRKAGKIKNSRIKICSDYGNITSASRFFAPGILYKQRLTHPSLPLAPFSTTKREQRSGVSVAGSNTSVIARENNQRILVKSHFIYRIQHYANGIIHLLYQTSINRIVLCLPYR